MAKFSLELALLTGVVMYADLGYIAASNRALDRDEVGNGIVLTWHKGTWGATDPFSWSPTACCFATQPGKHFVLVGGDCSFMDISGQDLVEGDMRPQLSRSDVGSVRDVRDIEGWALAVGHGGLVVSLTGLGQWSDVSRGMPVAAQLEAIHGFSLTDMYAVGIDGFMAHFDGKRWTPIESLTNLILSSVCCAGDGQVYVGGQEGILLRGRGSSWECLQTSGATSHIWDLEWFKGRLYASTYSAVHVLDKEVLKPVEMKSKQPNTAYLLSSCDDVLWSVGEYDIVSFDGKAWKHISTQV